VVIDAGLTLVVGTHPTPIIINTVFRTDPSVAPMTLFARSRAFYAAIGHRFTLLTSDHVDADLNSAAEANGWSMVAKLPAMVCRSPLPDRPIPARTIIRRADPRADIGPSVPSCGRDSPRMQTRQPRSMRSSRRRPPLTCPIPLPSSLPSTGATPQRRW